MDWTLSPNDTYDDLEELYGEMVGGIQTLYLSCAQHDRRSLSNQTQYKSN